jgi:hypothetical protein
MLTRDRLASWAREGPEGGQGLSRKLSKDNPDPKGTRKLAGAATANLGVLAALRCMRLAQRRDRTLNTL